MGSFSRELKSIRENREGNMGDPSKLNVESPCDSVPNRKEVKVGTQTVACAPAFTAALLTVAQSAETLRCLFTAERGRQVWRIHAAE